MARVVDASVLRGLFGILDDADGDPDLADLVARDLLTICESLPINDAHAVKVRLAKAMLRFRYGVSFEESDRTMGLSQAKAVDYLVFAIKKVELAASRIAFDLPKAPSWVAGGAEYYNLSLLAPTPSGAAERQVTISMIGDDGNTHAAAVMAGALQHYRPRAIVLLGMAAGASELSSSCVVGATLVVQGDYGTQTPEGLIPESRPFPVDPVVDRSLRFFDPHRHGWHQALASAAERAADSLRDTEFAGADVAVPDRQSLKFITRPIVAVDQKFEAGFEALDELLNRDNLAAQGLDMETLGLAALARQFDIPWIAFRGVSDSGEVTRSKSSQLSASVNAGVVLRSFIEHHFVFDEESRGDALTF